VVNIYAYTYPPTAVDLLFRGTASYLGSWNETSPDRSFIKGNVQQQLLAFLATRKRSGISS
jgi:hypothetical protein